MAARSGTLSAQQVDPLSWFTGPLIPLVFAIAAFVYGVTAALLTWNNSAAPAIQLGAVVVGASACLVIYRASKPLRDPIGWGTGVLAVALATAAMIISAVGYAGHALAIETWWGPGILGLVISSLGPYLAARRIVILGGVAVVVGAVASVLLLEPSTQNWGAVGVGIIVSYGPALSTAGSATFSLVIVSTMLRMLRSPARATILGDGDRDAAAEHVENVTVARLTARAVPFLESVAAKGTVSPEDRALAGQLARRMRDDLVTQSNLSWLDAVAARSRLVVVDPERLATRMNSAQRTTLRAMLEAVLNTPAIDSGSLMIELRTAADGATAVGISLDQLLPEGRRITHLAPYLLSLRTAFDDLKFEQRGPVSLSFRIPDDTD